jgi:hypothetical protein
VELLNQNFLTLEHLGWGMLGLLLTWLMVRRRQWNKETKEDPRNKEIRQYQADLRLVQKQLVESQQTLGDRQSEFELSLSTAQELKVSLAERDAELEKLRADLQEEMAKTRDLRVELTDQAQERLREQVIRKQAETQLEVAQAGSEAVFDEISRLHKESEQKSVTDAHLDIDLNEMLTEG